MSVTTFAERSRVELRVPHAATFLYRDFLGLRKNQLTINPYSREMDKIPRAKATYEHIGRTAILGNVDFFKVEYGEPINLPDPVDKVYHVVSQLTINAAHRAGRSLDDLLFLYGPIFDKDGRMKGVRGLAKPHFQPGRPFTETINYNTVIEQFVDVQSAAAGPTRIYNNPENLDISDPYYVQEDVQPTLDIPMPKNDADKLTLDYHDGGKQDAMLTAHFGGIPVYERPVLTGVKNHNAADYDRIMRPVSSPSILLALGQDALRGGYVMLGHEARNGNHDDPRYGTVIGGRSLIIPSQEMLEAAYF